MKTMSAPAAPSPSIPIETPRPSRRRELDEAVARLQESARTAKPISQILVDFGLVGLDTQLQITAEHLGTEVVSISDVNFTPELLVTIPAATARMYQCLPVADYGSTLHVAVADPLTEHERRDQTGDAGIDVDDGTAGEVERAPDLPDQAAGTPDHVGERVVDERRP